MSEIVFLVESVDRYGNPYTLTDRLKSLSPEWIEHFNCEILKTYKSVIGDKIKFQTYSQVQNYDSNKKYYYFISLDHFNFDFPVYFQMLGKSKLKHLHDNNIPLLFAHDLETIPHLDFEVFVKQLEWLFLMRGVYSDVQNEMIFLTAAGMVPHQKLFIEQYFYNKFKFIQSPLLLKYTADELISVYPTEIEIERLRHLPKDRLFTALNRGCRYQRLSLLHGLRSMNLLDHGYISVNETYHYSTNTVRSTSYYAMRVREDIAKGPIPLQSLDQWHFTDNRPKSLPPYPEQMWKSYFDIVPETGVLYFLPNPLDLTIITEKTVKSILFMRPFMINGGPYCLQVLKKYGFKTFEDTFDESYDTVENVIDRQEIIVNNVVHYADKYSDIEDKIICREDVIYHNRNHLLNVNYEQLLLNELMSV